ncbi:MAG: AtpZ/AtpI family protein [Pirellulales bacterium]|nr:AtpZ/AtpI family protein [Pirellulales bacterium]
MVSNPTDDRSAIARAYGWAAQITTISLEMVLPALGGVWLDGKLGTKFLFLLLGAVLGFAVGFWHLLKLTINTSKNAQDK